MNKEIEAKLAEGTAGFYIGSRLILPFKCTIIKLIVDNHIFTEFVGSEDVKVSQEAKNTSIYFRESGRLRHFEGSYESIKLIVAGLDEDLCDRATHLKVICSIKENHEAPLRMAGREDLFIE